MDPIRQFSDLFAEARSACTDDPTAMVLATVGLDGRPSARFVLLRGVDTRGFVFYTNLDSRKARELQTHPHAALCIHWAPLGRQVRVEGPVEPVAPEEADSYYASRPRESQIGAWASRQSAHLESREELERRVREFEQRFDGRDVPRPPFWSGFRIAPARIEFWTSKPGRLHERVVYTRAGDAWDTEMLYP